MVPFFCLDVTSLTFCLQGAEWQKLRKKGQVRPVKQGHSSEQMAVLAGIDPYPFAKEAAETGGFIKAQHLGDGLYTQPGLGQQHTGFLDPQLELKLVRRAAISGPEHAQ